MSVERLGIYVHWPFCAAICPYCDFNVYRAPRKNPDLAADFRAAYKAELRHAHGLRPGGQVETVFFGGGTPSLMPPSMVDALLSEIDRLWGVTKNAEITLEANPMEAAQKILTDFAAIGITRLSLGVQSLDDTALKFLGRTHTAKQAVTAFEMAQKTFSVTSLDLIYARPAQTLADWQTELRHALALAPDHLSAYQLTIEPNTLFFKQHAQKKISMPTDTLAADMYLATEDLCAAAGLPIYEISNHAKAEFACRHNKKIWRGGDYIGIGPGAAGRLTRDGKRYATLGVRQPKNWVQAVAQIGHGWQECVALSRRVVAAEKILQGLRLVEGILLADLKQAGIALPQEKIKQLRAEGFLRRDKNRLAATRQGRLVLDKIISDLVTDIF